MSKKAWRQPSFPFDCSKPSSLVLRDEFVRHFTRIDSAITFLLCDKLRLLLFGFYSFEVTWWRFVIPLPDTIFANLLIQAKKKYQPIPPLFHHGLVRDLWGGATTARKAAIKTLSATYLPVHSGIYFLSDQSFWKVSAAPMKVPLSMNNAGWCHCCQWCLGHNFPVALATVLNQLWS